MGRTACSSAGLAALLALAACGARPATITVDTSQHHQTMAGWEATARLWEFDKKADRFNDSWLAQRAAIVALLVDGAGIDRLRLEIRSGAENPVDYWAQFASGRIGYNEFKRHFYEKINDNADPLRLDPAGVQFSELDWRVENIVLPVKARVEAQGRRFRLNLTYVDFKWSAEQGSLSHARQPQEYAELIVATLEHLKSKYGLVPDDLEIILEPDNSRDWRGAEIGAAIVALGPRLKMAGLDQPAIIAPSSAQARRAFTTFAALAAIPGAAPQVATLSYHRYDGAPGPTLLRMLRTTAHASGAATAMLEYVDGTIDDLFADLTYADATAWQQFGIATRATVGAEPAAGWLIVARERPGVLPVLALSDSARALAQVFVPVVQGSVRVATRSSSADVQAAAFVTPAGGVVLVLRRRDGGPVTITGLPPGRYRLSSDAANAVPRLLTVGSTVELITTALATTTLAAQ